uniref:X1.D.D8.3 n=1 Tax=Schmidtea mediterranea TaxID=79327 RepID=V9XQR7_SCHMD|nr:X1.D.D8.3 [Schmidtea mediterranea]
MKIFSALLLLIFGAIFSEFKQLKKNEKIILKKCDKRYSNVDRNCDVAYDAIRRNCSNLHQSLSSAVNKAKERINIRCQIPMTEICLALRKKFIEQQYQDFLKLENQCQKALLQVDKSCITALDRVDRLCSSVYNNIGCSLFS